MAEDSKVTRCKCGAWVYVGHSCGTCIALNARNGT